MFSSSTYIPNMKTFPFLFPRKKRQIGFQTKISQLRTDFVVYQLSAPPLLPLYNSTRTTTSIKSITIILVASLAEGTAEVGVKDSQLSARLRECPSASRSGLILMSLSLSRLYGKLPWWCSPGRDLNVLEFYA